MNGWQVTWLMLPWWQWLFGSYSCQGDLRQLSLHLESRFKPVDHSKKDSSAQEFHGLFTESFQPVSKFGKWTQCASLDTQEVNVILHLWLLVHWVHFPNLETAWKLQVNKECKRLCTAVIHAVDVSMDSGCLSCFCAISYLHSSRSLLRKQGNSSILNKVYPIEMHMLSSYLCCHIIPACAACAVQCIVIDRALADIKARIASISNQRKP